MIYGIKNWNNPAIRYDQTQNSLEAIIKKLFAMHNIKISYLISCGLSTAGCLYEGIGWLTESNVPKFPNGEQIQFDDWIAMYCNNPQDTRFPNYPMPNNMYGEPYIIMAKLLFNKTIRYIENISFDMAITELKKHNGIQICLKDPAHWIPIIAYDDKQDVLIFNDSWGSRQGNKNGGLHEEMTRAMFANVKNFFLIYEADK
jgi:hypothetical protein